MILSKFVISSTSRCLGLIQDLTNVPNGQTMFVNWIEIATMMMCYASICNNSSTWRLTARVLSHLLCPMNAHTGFCKPQDFLELTMAFGKTNLLQISRWDAELGFETWSLLGVFGSAVTNGTPTHPNGSLRVLFIQHGKYVTKAMQSNGISLTIQNLINEVMAFREQNLPDILRLERRFYVF